MKQKLTKNKILFNSLVGITNRVVVLLLGMIFRKIFMEYLGESLSGLSSLYSNILNFLSLATAGLSVSALHKLYHYNATQNEDEIARIETFVRYFFRCVSVFIFAMGILFTFFLDKLIYNNVYSMSFLRVVFLLQVLGECIHYWFYSKRVILQANEKNYIIGFVELFTNIMFYLLQMVLVVATQNYVWYLITVVVKYLIMGLIIHTYSVRKYHYLKQKSEIHFGKMRYLFADMKDTVLMQLSTFVFISTDSVVISKFLGLLWVNLYDNYMIILNALTAALDEINAALRSTYGNRLAADGSKEAKILFVQKTTFIQYLIATFCSCSLYCLMSDFIALWLGDKYIVTNITVLLFSLNFFVVVFGSPMKNFMSMSGNFAWDKKITFSSAVINLGSSILLVRYYGIGGVIFGTMLGNILMFMERSIVFYTKIVKQSAGEYVKSLILYASSYIICFISTIGVANCITLQNACVEFVIKIVVCICVPNGINLLLYSRNEQMQMIIRKIRHK